MFCWHFLLGNLIPRDKRTVLFYKNVLRFLKGVVSSQFAILGGLAPKLGGFLAGTEDNLGFIM